MNILQQKSLISFAVTHYKYCLCDQCNYFGGVDELFRIYSPKFFTSNLLRRIWGWLLVENKKGSCYIVDLDLESTLAPKLSILVACSTESMVFYPKYLLLKDVLLNS